jgi:hypothetical protein
MEYEIEDETRLFDESTNPSLERGSRPATASTRHGAAEDKKKAQKAVHIPEEEHQLA